jgi:hypothetical protein
MHMHMHMCMHMCMHICTCMSVLYPPLKKSRPFGLHTREGGQGRLLPRGAAPPEEAAEGGLRGQGREVGPPTDSDSNESDKEDLKQ